MTPPQDRHLVHFVGATCDSNVCVAKVVMVYYNPRGGIEEVVEAGGTARRNPADKNRPAIGKALATARAMQSAGKRLEKRILNKYIKHPEDIAIMKAKAKPAPDWILEALAAGTKPAKPKKKTSTKAKKKTATAKKGA